MKLGSCSTDQDMETSHPICTVCRAEVTGRLCRPFQCRHYFHFDCLMQWAKFDIPEATGLVATCPNCRLYFWIVLVETNRVNGRIKWKIHYLEPMVLEFDRRVARRQARRQRVTPFTMTTRSMARRFRENPPAPQHP